MANNATENLELDLERTPGCSLTTMTQPTSTTVPLGPWTVPALGVGTWALGGDWDFDGQPAGWGAVDDDESIAALRVAYDGGVQIGRAHV